jgi:hypothetical protein
MKKKAIVVIFHMLETSLSAVSLSFMMEKMFM